MLPHAPAGVTVCNARGVYDEPVAEWVVGAIGRYLRGEPLANVVRAPMDGVAAAA